MKKMNHLMHSLRWCQLRLKRDVENHTSYLKSLLADAARDKRQIFLDISMVSYENGISSFLTKALLINVRGKKLSTYEIKESFLICRKVKKLSTKATRYVFSTLSHYTWTHACKSLLLTDFLNKRIIIITSTYWN